MLDSHMSRQSNIYPELHIPFLKTVQSFSVNHNRFQRQSFKLQASQPVSVPHFPKQVKCHPPPQA
ncbi:hypothetical protein BJV77DRAFT_1055952 [Russula vinacea]|nr:hypothetical protein BJV77DRAFT_1055952 [Russula vinacea]